MGSKATRSTRQLSSDIAEFKTRISDRFGYLDADFSVKRSADSRGEISQDTQSLQSVQVIDNSDPRLTGWQPIGNGICGPKGAKFTIRHIEVAGGGFATAEHCIVRYDIELPSGRAASEIALFTKITMPQIYSVGALKAHLEKALGDDIFHCRDKWQHPYREALERHGSVENMEKSDLFAINESTQAIEREQTSKIPEPYLRRAVTPLCNHLDEMGAIFQVLEPLGKEGELLFKAIENCVDDIFNLAVIIKKRELESIHLSDALRGKAVVSGGIEGGQAQAERSSAHAAAWKRNFAAWFQPLISQHSSGRGISRDDAIDLAKKEWPSGGFAGLPGLQRQMAFPSRQTMLNTLKKLEKDGTITRKRPPKART